MLGVCVLCGCGCERGGVSREVGESVVDRGELARGSRGVALEWKGGSWTRRGVPQERRQQARAIEGVLGRDTCSDGGGNEGGRE